MYVEYIPVNVNINYRMYVVYTVYLVQIQKLIENKNKTFMHFIFMTYFKITLLFQFPSHSNNLQYLHSVHSIKNNQINAFYKFILGNLLHISLTFQRNYLLGRNYREIKKE